jgi:hypothetical protein
VLAVFPHASHRCHFEIENGGIAGIGEGSPQTQPSPGLLAVKTAIVDGAGCKGSGNGGESFGEALNGLFGVPVAQVLKRGFPLQSSHREKFRAD